MISQPILDQFWKFEGLNTLIFNSRPSLFYDILLFLTSRPSYDKSCKTTTGFFETKFVSQSKIDQSWKFAGLNTLIFNSTQSLFNDILPNSTSRPSYDQSSKTTMC